MAVGGGRESHMAHWATRLRVLGALAVAALLFAGASQWQFDSAPVSAQVAPTPTPTPVLPAHGVGFSKGCQQTRNVGDPYECAYAISSDPLIDTALDTLNVTALTDVVHAFAGP